MKTAIITATMLMLISGGAQAFCSYAEAREGRCIQTGVVVPTYGQDFVAARSAQSTPTGMYGAPSRGMYETRNAPTYERHYGGRQYRPSQPESFYEQD